MISQTRFGVKEKNPNLNPKITQESIPQKKNFKEKEKWKSWNSRRNLSTYQAEVEYITIVNKLIKKYGLNIKGVFFLEKYL